MLKEQTWSWATERWCRRKQGPAVPEWQWWGYEMQPGQVTLWATRGKSGHSVI